MTRYFKSWSIHLTTSAEHFFLQKYWYNLLMNLYLYRMTEFYCHSKIINLHKSIFVFFTSQHNFIALFLNWRLYYGLFFPCLYLFILVHIFFLFHQLWYHCQFVSFTYSWLYKDSPGFSQICLLFSSTDNANVL